MAQNPMKNQASRRRNPQSGSAIIIIFVFIALFVAVSFVISQSFRGGGASITSETAKVKAQEIIDFGRQTKDAIKGLKIDGCTDTQINFDGALGGDYVNPNAPTDGHCNVFGKNGGGLSWPKFSDGMSNDALFFGANWVKAYSGGSVMGTSAPELTMIRQVDMNTCTQVNKLLGNPYEWVKGANIYGMNESGGTNNGSWDPDAKTWIQHVTFKGDYTLPSDGQIVYFGDMKENGKDHISDVPPPVGCFCDSGDGCSPPVVYYFYQVLLVR